MECNHILKTLYQYRNPEGKLCQTTKCIVCGLIRTERYILTPRLHV